MKKVKVSLFPSGVEVWVAPGETLREALMIAGLSMDTPCAGWGVCGKCKVRIEPILRSLEVTTQELKHLSMEEIQQGYRLACQVNLTQDVEVHLPPDFLEVLQKTIDISRPAVGTAFPLRPVISKVYLELPAPTLEDRLADWERLERGLVENHCLPRQEPGDNGLHLDGEMLRTLPSIMREADYRVTVVLYENKLIAVEPGDTSGHLYGVALDLGTTTMAGALLDLNTGEQLAVVSKANPQLSVGADVISRISFVSQGERNLEDLQQLIVATVNLIIEELLMISGVSRRYVYEITAVGNTVIHHLFLGLDPTFLGQGPYVPVVTRPVTVRARRQGIRIAEGGYLYLLPNIAGFVGGDAVGGDPGDRPLPELAGEAGGGYRNQRRDHPGFGGGDPGLLHGGGTGLRGLPHQARDAGGDGSNREGGHRRGCGAGSDRGVGAAWNLGVGPDRRGGGTAAAGGDRYDRPDPVSGGDAGWSFSESAPETDRGKREA